MSSASNAGIVYHTDCLICEECSSNDHAAAPPRSPSGGSEEFVPKVQTQFVPVVRIKKSARGQRGERGPRGEKGDKGDAAKPVYIVSWQLGREKYRLSPHYSNGTVGPILELRGLFEQFLLDRSEYCG
jgi:hypothetical protein